MLLLRQPNGVVSWSYEATWSLCKLDWATLLGPNGLLLMAGGPETQKDRPKIINEDQARNSSMWWGRGRAYSEENCTHQIPTKTPKIINLRYVSLSMHTCFSVTCLLTLFFMFLTLFALVK